MKCNIPKVKNRDLSRLYEALTQVKCCRCGRVIEVMSHSYAVLNFDKRRYENRLCVYCKEKEIDNEQREAENTLD